MDKNKTPLPGDVLKKVIPPLTAWAVAKLMERPQVKAAFSRVDRASQVRARRARQNAIRNRRAPGRVMSPIAGSLGLRYTRSASR